MPHFLSLIVNNEGKYCARITRRISFPSSSEISYSTWNGQTETEKVESVVNEYIESFPFDIQIEEDTTVRDGVLQRIKEIEKSKEEEKKNKVPVHGFYGSHYGNFFGARFEDDFPEPDYRKDWCDWNKKDKKGNKVVPVPVQGTLFNPDRKGVNPSTEIPSKETKISNNYSDIKVPADVVKRTFIQMITGSVVSGYSEKFNIEEWINKVMVKAYTRRFPDQEELTEWLDFYIEYLVWNTPYPADCDAEQQAEALADALLDECVKYNENDILAIMELKLEEMLG